MGIKKKKTELPSRNQKLQKRHVAELLVDGLLLYALYCPKAVPAQEA